MVFPPSFYIGKKIHIGWQNFGFIYLEAISTMLATSLSGFYFTNPALITNFFEDNSFETWNLSFEKRRWTHDWRRNSIFRYKRPKRAFGALHFYTSSERIARVASCIEPYFSLQIHTNPSWLTVYRHRKWAVTQLYSTAVNTTILT